MHLREFVAAVCFALVCAVGLSSCAVLSGGSDKVIRWNTELNEGDNVAVSDKCNPTKKLRSIASANPPITIPGTEIQEERYRIVGLPCAESGENPIYDIPKSRVKRITYVSDPLQPPVELDNPDVLAGCCRTRTGWWIFDKVELRGSLAFRGSKDSVIYSTPAGQEIYRSSLFGTDRGGSSFLFGGELGLLWNVPWLDQSGKFQAGLLTGIYPTDASTFIPVGLNLRYTFSQTPPASALTCHTWYVYGTAGLPLDFVSEAPLFGNAWERQRYFWGVGIGRDWAVSCTMDFSIDLGIRQMNHPLPQIICCPDVPDGDRNPFRLSNALFLRVGLTF